MFIAYFTEQPLSTYPAERAFEHYPDDHPARDLGDTVLLFSNRFFDPVEGARLYRERQAEYLEAERVGFDGIMVNEHHNGPFCMQPRCNITSAMLAALTSRIKIVQLGNPIPLWENPVHLAEETAVIDMVSGGRLVAGVVRGGGTEQFAANSNPAFNRERFEEGHDLLVKAWTEPGPFRWEGEQYQFPIVNPWAVPLQQPHPRVWIPGVASAETIAFAANHRYPYIALATSLDETHQIWKYYADTALTAGYEAGVDLRGYLMRCHVQDTEERALENALAFNWMQGEFTGMTKPALSQPAGYSSVDSRLKRLEKFATRRMSSREELLARDLERGTMIAGNPEQTIERIRTFLEQTRCSILLLWGNDGDISHEDSMRCIRLLGEEVLPAVREIGDELGLEDPFQADSPVSLADALRRDRAAATV